MTGAGSPALARGCGELVATDGSAGEGLLGFASLAEAGRSRLTGAADVERRTSDGWCAKLDDAGPRPSGASSAEVGGGGVCVSTTVSRTSGDEVVR